MAIHGYHGLLNISMLTNKYLKLMNGQSQERTKHIQPTQEDHFRTVRGWTVFLRSKYQ